MSYVKAISNYRKFDGVLVGGKIANLGELFAAGVPGAPGIAIEVGAFKLVLDSDQQIRVLVSQLGANLELAEIERLSAAIKLAFEAAVMPAEVEQDIRNACSDNTAIFAVRSSATAEDQPDASFAGQQDTYLGIRGASAVIDAVKRCWASLYNVRAIVYRNENGYDHFEVGIAVAVQQLVKADSAGIMFTMDPVTGNRGVINIDAGWGLGELIVSGRVTPDHYVVRKDDLEVVERKTSPQSFKMVWNGHGTEDIAVPKHQVNRQKLNQKKLRRLARMAKRIEQHYGVPQDIEWAFSGKKLYILQARPVTVLGQDHFDDEPAVIETARLLMSGFAASPGVAVGRVRILRSPADCQYVQPGEIIVTEQTDPNYMYGIKQCVAVVTEIGGRTCHAAIVTREQGKPSVVGAKGILSQVKDGMLITVDGSHGLVFEGYATQTVEWGNRRTSRLEAALLEAAGKQTKLKVMSIMADPDRAEEVAAMPNDGVGLLRLEFILQNTVKAHPRAFIEQGRQEEFISMLENALLRFVRAFSPRTVVVRTTDFKTNEYAELEGSSHYEQIENNPMMGLRGVVRYLEYPEDFRLECEAMRRVIFEHGFKNLVIMFPFVRDPDELRQVIALAESFDLRRDQGVKFWMMLEVPSNVILLEEFVAQGVCGLSIGSNDLTQLVLGADRDGVKALQARYNETNPAVMKVMREIGARVLALRAKGIEVDLSFCGNAVSDFDEYVRLVAAADSGFTSASVHPDKIAEMRMQVAAIEEK